MTTAQFPNQTFNMPLLLAPYQTWAGPIEMYPQTNLYNQNLKYALYASDVYVLPMNYCDAVDPTLQLCF